MSDTLERQLSTWEARSPVPSPSFSGILKALTKLHEAVSGVLPPQQVPTHTQPLPVTSTEKRICYFSSLCNFMCSVVKHVEYCLELCRECLGAHVQACTAHYIVFDGGRHTTMCLAAL